MVKLWYIVTQVVGFDNVIIASMQEYFYFSSNKMWGRFMFEVLNARYLKKGTLWNIKIKIPKRQILRPKGWRHILAFYSEYYVVIASVVIVLGTLATGMTWPNAAYLSTCPYQEFLGVRECPYKFFSIQVPKFPRAHHPFLRDSNSIDPLAGLIWGGLGCPSPPQLFVHVEVSKFHILLNCYSFDHSFWHVELEDHKNLPTTFPPLSQTPYYKSTCLQSK